MANDIDGKVSLVDLVQLTRENGGRIPPRSASYRGGGSWDTLGNVGNAENVADVSNIPYDDLLIWVHTDVMVYT